MRRITRWVAGSRAAFAAGLLVVALPPAALVTGVLVSRPEKPAPPHAAPRPAPVERARWQRSDWSSLNLLRRVVADEAHSAAVAVAGCEPRGSAGFRSCAFRALARAGAAGNFNSRALVALIDDGDPPRACAHGVRALAGATAMLGNASASTLRHAGVGERWRDVRAGMRWVLGAARIVRRVAASPEWESACRPGGNGPAA